MKLMYLEAGEIVTTHGVRGECKVLPWSDSPEFLCGFSRIRIGDKDYRIEKCRIQNSCNLVKIEGIDTMEDAQKLRGKTVLVYREDAPADMIFVAELIGIQVFCNGQQIGLVEDVLDYPGNKVYVVKGEHTYMIPAVKEFILSTDMQAGVMEGKLIEGMGTHED